MMTFEHEKYYKHYINKFCGKIFFVQKNDMKYYLAHDLFYKNKIFSRNLSNKKLLGLNVIDWRNKYQENYGHDLTRNLIFVIEFLILDETNKKLFIDVNFYGNQFCSPETDLLYEIKQ